MDTVPRLSIKKQKKNRIVKKNRQVIQLFRLQKNFNFNDFSQRPDMTRIF